MGDAWLLSSSPVNDFDLDGLGDLAQPRLDVLTIGHALLDVLAGADDGFLVQQGLVKGSMSLIDAERAQVLYDLMGPGTEASGGSAANTATGVVACGGTAAFIGTVADDQLGEIFVHDMSAAGVLYRTPVMAPPPATGRSLVLVTPEGERTMNTYLGAASSVSLEHLDEELLQGAAITYVEGYMLDTKNPAEALQRTVELVRGAGGRVSLTLSDLYCVERHRDLFMDLLDGSVDICFGNEEEACALFGVTDLNRAVEELAKRCEVVAITRGSKGSLLVADGGRVDVDAEPVNVIDTTGAGDLYAAGVLTGLARGWQLEECGRMGSRAAAAAVSQMGARLSRDIKPQGH